MNEKDIFDLDKITSYEDAHLVLHWMPLGQSILWKGNLYLKSKEGFLQIPFKPTGPAIGQTALAWLMFPPK